MPKNNGYELDYSNIPAMKRDALEKAKRYFSKLTHENTKLKKDNDDDPDVSFLVDEANRIDSTVKATIRDANALKAYLLDLYNNAHNAENFSICKSLVGVLEYLDHGRPSDVSNSLTDIEKDKPELDPIEQDVINLMNNSSAARHYLVLFKEQLDEILQQKMMLCELGRRKNAYVRKDKTQKKHKKLVSLTSLKDKLEAALFPSTAEAEVGSSLNLIPPTKPEFSKEAWRKLNKGRLSHKTYDLLKFYQVETMITLVADKAAQNDDEQGNDEYIVDNDPADTASNTSSRQTDVVDNDVTDNIATSSSSSIKPLPQELVEKYNKLSALASGYRALSLLSPQVGSISSTFYRTFVDYSEQQKVERKALAFCVDMIAGNKPEPLSSVKSKNLFAELTDKEQIALYRFFEHFEKKKKSQPYANAIDLLNKPENQNHDFWQHYGHQLTLETPEERNKGKGSNQTNLKNLEPRVVYLNYNQTTNNLRYSVILSTGKGEVIDNVELRGVAEGTKAIYGGKYVQFVSSKPTKVEKGVLYIYPNPNNALDLQCSYQSAGTSSISLKEDMNCQFLDDVTWANVLKRCHNPQNNSYKETFDLKDTVIEAARSVGSYGLQSVGYSKTERKAAEDDVFALLKTKNHVHPYRVTKFKEVNDAHKKQPAVSNVNLAHHTATR